MLNFKIYTEGMAKLEYEMYFTLSSLAVNSFFLSFVKSPA